MHQGLGFALEEKDHNGAGSFRPDKKKKHILDRAQSTVILSLNDSILREIFKEKIIVRIWNKEEAVYMKKSLAYRFFLKKRLYTFLMKEGMPIQEHIDTFNKIILELIRVENVKIRDEVKAFFLQSSLSQSFFLQSSFVDTMLYGRTILILEDVKASLSSKEILKNNGMK